ncbi:ester cyclase [Streptomyces sp. Z26]|uniref:ester cyclase n=1 Tax=Streptomyces TaxID=1883 RepID=UPI001F0B8406|nr:ester cyclase [Streptomyces sp. Z26]
MTTTPEQNIALVRTAYRAMENGDLDAAVGMLTEDFLAHVHGAAEPLPGRDVWRYGAQGMRDAFPDLTITVRDIFATGDKVTVLVLMEGTHQGAFQQFEASGARVAFRSVEVYRVAGGRIAEEWVAPDLLQLMQQIGAAPVGL